jgi:hypothetical protein
MKSMSNKKEFHYENNVFVVQKQAIDLSRKSLRE